jgi:hypothetical protein
MIYTGKVNIKLIKKIEILKMRALLKSYDLSDNEIKLYIESVGKFPLTFNEIRSFMSKQSEEETQQILNNLLEKKLLMHVKPQYSESLPHYVSIPPIAAILNSITEFTRVTDIPKLKEAKQHPKLEKFQDDLFQDLENISQDLIEVISNRDTTNQTTEVLSEVEQNVRKFVQVIFSDIIKLITPLKVQTGLDGRDINKLIKSVKQKINESDEIAENMFSQFRDIVKGMESSNIPQIVEAFKTFIRRFGESIDKRVHEISLEAGGQNSLPTQNIEVIEKSLYNILTDYISKDTIRFEKLWHVSSYDKIKEIISILIDKSTEELTIIVPNIKDFIPIEKLKLDYSVDLSTTPKPQVNGSTKNKSQKPKSKQPSISKKQKQEFEEKLDEFSKKVSGLKGFELTHNVTEILSMISEINSESVIIESIQGWLNRLLVIRKHLDSNTQYLLLENIDKWKKEYTRKVEKEIEEEMTEETSDQVKLEKPVLEKFIKKKIAPKGFHLKIISSEPHDNKHVLAIKKKKNFEYFRLLKNNIIAILGDSSYLVFGIFQKIDHKPYFEITGFYTTFRALIESFIPVISRISSEARSSKEVQINIGFNEIIENINDYPGRKIGKRLKKLLDVAFEKEGISLNILKLKLLIGKIENIYTPLPDEMKEYVIGELNRLNTDLSSIDLVYPPEFRPPILEEEAQEESEEILMPEEYEIEPVDPDKINSLFEIFLEKIEELQGEEIVAQIDKFIEVVLNLQGYSQIINWRNSLKNSQELLKKPYKEKIKSDFLRWKWGILNQTPPTEALGGEKSSDDYTSSKSDDVSSLFEEEYISPGLSQTQFQSDSGDSSVPTDGESNKTDPSVKMKEIFDSVEGNFADLSGIDISKKLQNILDIILETEGYSMALKEIKDWVSKLRKFRKPLNEEVKEDFVISFFKWKEKYSKEDSDNQTLDFGPSTESSEVDISNGKGIGLSGKIDGLIQDANNSPGNQLSSSLQDISDIVLKSHGAVAANVIRQWISKLRSIRGPLEDEIKGDFLEELEKWKEKFA